VTVASRRSIHLSTEQPRHGLRGGPALLPVRRLALALATMSILALTLSAGALATRSAGRESLVYEYVRYGPSPLEVADVYPSSAPRSPTVILVHGGGWRKQGQLSRFELESKSLQREGFTVFEINYDQDSPAVPAFPLEPNDVIAATRWAIANGARFNANPSDVVLLGGSAGGNLVALAAEQLDAASPGTVRGVVSLSGPMNFLTLMPMLEEDTISNESFNTSVHRALGFEEGGVFPQAYAEQWSPALHVPAKSCPNWLIFNSETEFIPLSQAQGLYASLVKAKCKATLQVVPGSEHAFMYFHRVKPAIFSFIAEQ